MVSDSQRDGQRDSCITRWSWFNTLCFLALISLAARLPAQDQDAAEPRTLTVRLRPDVSVDTLKTLAKASESTTQKITGVETISGVLHDAYGVSTSKTRLLLQDFNPDFDAAVRKGPNAVIEVPAGPSWRFKVKVPAAPDMTVRQQAQRLIGNSGPKTKLEIDLLNPTLVGKWDQRVNAPIVMPYLSGFVTYHLRPDADIAVVTNALKQDPAVGPFDLTTGQRLIPSLTHLSATPDGCIDEPQQAAVNPYGAHIGQVLSGLAHPLAPTTIAIMDSGVAQNDVRFDNFWKMSKNSRVDIGPGAFMICQSNSVGCNFLSKVGFPLDDATGEGLASHGTHVAGLASGRLLGPDLIPKINLNIRLMILKVADSAGNIDSGRVFSAAFYAESGGARVVNLSLAGPSELAIYDAIGNNKSVLFVAAAGNDHTPLQREDRSNLKYGYPALYGLDLPNIISVAALDQKGGRACFSNYGSVVDIAAPGVELESTVTGGTAMLSGTSQAAPLVSFAAALLLSAGYGPTPAAIKNRLIVSGDYSESLKDVVSSGSSLNIEKALAFRSDVIELLDHSLIKGKIDSPGPIYAPGEVKPLLWDNIEKIVFHPSRDSTQSRITVVNNGTLLNVFTELPFQQINGKDPAGNSIHLELQDVIDITLGAQ